MLVSRNPSNFHQGSSVTAIKLSIVLFEKITSKKVIYYKREISLVKANIVNADKNAKPIYKPILL